MIWKVFESNIVTLVDFRGGLEDNFIPLYNLFLDIKKCKRLKLARLITISTKEIE